MKLFEMNFPPERAGVAEIVLDEEITIPVRKDSVITLPSCGGLSEYYPIKGGSQFLFRSYQPPSAYGRPASVFFGGTDESPFLAELSPEAFDAFVKGGQDGLFDAMKPDFIKSHEKMWGVDRTRRQGDIFAYGLPMSWKKLITKYFFNADAGEDNLELRAEKGEFEVFRTRHTLKGFWIDVPHDKGMTHIVMGTLEAPDHAPLELRGPHLIAQAALLAQPQHAD